MREERVVTRRERTMIYLRGIAHTLRDRDTESRTLVGEGFTQEFGITGARCTPPIPDESSNRWELTFADSGDWLNIVHPRSFQRTLGYAVGADGTVLASQALFSRDANGQFQPDGHWNVLTNQNLGAIFPEAPASSGFYPLGVLR